ncbi:odorant receptor 22c-like [Achroia grisella]|uniref:odorant receptor 22c-like n=1 Tax=Achroia grisella TaxID=688607 RepID=UPI0027D2AEC0|nr:odorant receptor 22c-like [Achroia grisella]
MFSWAIRRTGLQSSSTNNNVHYLANLATICFVTTFILQLIELYFAKENIKRLFECFSVLSFCGMGLLKLMSLRCKYRHWQYIFNQVQMLENKQISRNIIGDNEFDLIYYIRSYTTKYSTMSTILIRLYGSTLIIHILSPIVEYIYIKVKGCESVYPHILPGWAPFDGNIFGYIATVAIEIASSIYCVCVHVAFDLSSVGLMIFLCGQYRLIRDYSENIGKNGNDCCITKENDENALLSIRYCHQTHNILINIIGDLSKLLKDILGIYFFVATLTLCSVAVRLNMETLSLTQLISLLQYLSATVTQLFLFCLYGNAVLNESSVGMGEGPNGAAYWCLSPRVRRELTTLAVGMSRPHHLSAGPFHALNLPSFIQIVRTAYSYYAVIRK